MSSEYIASNFTQLVVLSVEKYMFCYKMQLLEKQLGNCVLQY
jgi:hypothetical protein